MKRIASVAVMAGDRLLIGKRSDDGRWNLPGGHVDEGESPSQGAARELHEETGIAVHADRLLSIGQNQVTTFTGKQIEVSSYLLILPEIVDTQREGTDPGEAHDWSWTNVAHGLPQDIAAHWHNKTDSTMAALGLQVSNNGAMDKSALITDEEFEKAWPREYTRVQGQTKDKGVASKKQYRYMQAMAAQGDKDAKAYLANSSKGGEGLPESGTDGARGERSKGSKKGKGSDKAEKADDGSPKNGNFIAQHAKIPTRTLNVTRPVMPNSTQKADDQYEETTARQVKAANRPKVSTFADQVKGIKDKYAEKKPKSFSDQVKDVKSRYKNSLQKAGDLFFGKVEGLLAKGYANEELLSHVLDVELAFRDSNNETGLTELYKSADRLFDAAMTLEEQTVFELSYLAREGCEVSYVALEKFAIDMYEELVKHSTVEDVVASAVRDALEKSSYGPKKIGDEKVSLYNDTDNINRKANRTGVVHENAGRNAAEQKYTPSVQGTFAQQATREAKRDQKKSKLNPVKTYTDEEKAKMMAERTTKSEDNSKVVGKKNGHSVRKVHGYHRYTSGPKRGEYVHRHEAEKRLGRKLGSKEHVDHKSGNRGSTKNTKVMSAGDHSAKTNSSRANTKGYSGSKRYEHTRD